MYWHSWLCNGSGVLENCVSNGSIKPFPILLICDGCDNKGCAALRAAALLRENGWRHYVYVLSCKNRVIDQSLHYTHLKAVLHKFYAVLKLSYSNDLAPLGEDLLQEHELYCCSIL